MFVSWSDPHTGDKAAWRQRMRTGNHNPTWKAMELAAARKIRRGSLALYERWLHKRCAPAVTPKAVIRKQKYAERKQNTRCARGQLFYFCFLCLKADPCPCLPLMPLGRLRRWGKDISPALPSGPGIQCCSSSPHSHFAGALFRGIWQQQSTVLWCICTVCLCQVKWSEGSSLISEKWQWQCQPPPDRSLLQSHLPPHWEASLPIPENTNCVRIPTI